MENDDTETWVRFSEIGINARMRNALELFAQRKENGAGLIAPVSRGSGGMSVEAAGLELASCGSDCDVAPLTSQLRGSYRPLLTSAHGSGREKEPPQELVKELPVALTSESGGDATGLTTEGGTTVGEEFRTATGSEGSVLRPVAVSAIVADASADKELKRA